MRWAWSVNLRHPWTLFFLHPPKGVTNNVITSQVASGLLKGLFPLSSPQYISASVEQSSIDSLEPTYPCPTAYTILSNYTTGNGGQEWQTHLTQAASLYEKLDQVSGISSPDTAGWHVSFDQCVLYFFPSFLVAQSTSICVFPVIMIISVPNSVMENLCPVVWMIPLFVSHRTKLCFFFIRYLFF